MPLEKEPLTEDEVKQLVIDNITTEEIGFIINGYRLKYVNSYSHIFEKMTHNLVTEPRFSQMRMS